MIGSYAKETHPPTYGLTTNIDSFNPFRPQYYEYAAIVRDVRGARTWRHWMGYLFAPPGWRPATEAVQIRVAAEPAVAIGQ